MSAVNEFKNTSTAVCSCDDFLIESKDNMENDVSIENNVGIENDVSIENDVGIENAVSIENDVGIENDVSIENNFNINELTLSEEIVTTKANESSIQESPQVIIELVNITSETNFSSLDLSHLSVETSMEVDIGASKTEMSSLLTPERETSQICSQSIDKETYQKILKEQAEKKKNERQIKQEVIEKTSKESEAVVEKNTREKSLAKTASKASSKAATRASSKVSSKATPIARSKASSKATSIARSKATIKTIPKKESKVLCDITNKGKKED
ncbi:hypothetical protein TKK_0000917 [Trichogramma kaykai]